MIRIYTSSFRLFFSALPLLLLLAVILEGLALMFQGTSGATAGRTIGLLFIAYMFHRHFLFGEPLTLRRQTGAADTRPFRAGRFILIALALLALPLAGALWVTYSVQSPGAARADRAGTMLLTMMPLYLLALGLFGTLLPASVTRDPRYTLRAGMQQALPTMGRLILGSGLVGAFNLVLVSGLEIWASQWPALQGPVPMALLGLLATTFGFLTSILGAATLCAAYDRVIARQDASSQSAAPAA
ncbi:hypothetical protein [Frigidibacter mobilis]|uniref:Uncharacterized protein n=1 Tax=Frigidibacter mobilis TaxID=1335048 RepID=A0A159Z249_9RHOB|nr:hypothetical protein [Frigidibacter mobilis]AMY68168.1 hypothetical protein AKL17_0909 [Frigidibacter mobilis]